MKAQATASAIRATITVTEARDLANLARDAQAMGIAIPERLTDALALLDYARVEVQHRQTRKRLDKQAVRDAEQRRRDRERHDFIDGFSVSAVRADYADCSPDPDSRQWVDIALKDVLSRPIPDQCEIRRGVWKVRIYRRDEDDRIISDADCTETPDPAEITPLARRLIALVEQVPA